MHKKILTISRPIFVYVDISIMHMTEKNYSCNKARLFISCFLVTFRAFSIDPEKKTSKTSKVNQQYVLNLYMVHHFPKNLDRTITFNSVTLKITQTEPHKYIIFLTKQIIFRVDGG